MTQYTRVCRKCKTQNRSTARFCSVCGQAIPSAIEIFLSYAHEDEVYREKLSRQLSTLRRVGRATIWSDQDIPAGENWELAIKAHLLTAEVILLLISSDFIASDYCYSIEMEDAVQRAQNNQACVIPIILRPVHWRETPFGVLQALPQDAKAVSSWRNQDEALVNVVQGIRDAIKQIYGP